MKYFQAAEHCHPGAGDHEEGEGVGQQGWFAAEQIFSSKYFYLQIKKPAEAEKFKLEKLAEAERLRIVLEAEANAEALAVRGEAEAFAIGSFTTGDLES